MQILRYCPKCGNIDVGSNKCCRFCNHETFDTKYTIDDFLKGDLSVLKQKIIEEYAKKSPEFDEELERKREEEEERSIHGRGTYTSTQQKNVPKCPTCGSINIKHITTLNRLISVGTFGIFSGKIGKNYECLDCKAKW